MPNRITPFRSLPNAYRLLISDEAFRSLLSFASRDSRTEAGGILLGRIFDADGKVVIERITTPNAKDKRGWNFFVRSRPVAQSAINEAWKDSRGEQIYLGEWHSHPEAHPTPSRRDRCMIRNLFQQSEMEIDFLLTVIVGYESIWVAVQTANGLTDIGMETLEPHQG